MANGLSKKITNILENENITIHGTYKQDKEYYTELGFYSDLGEDVIITVFHKNNDKSFIKSLEEWYEDFDPEEHANEWYNARNKVAGVPQSLRALLDDADGIDKKIKNIITQLNKI